MLCYFCIRKKLPMKSLKEKKLTSGDVIEFQSINTNETSPNILKINYNTGHIVISFDEIRQLFIKEGYNDIFCNTIKVGNQIFQIFNLTLDHFRRLVDGKRFKVYVDNEMYALKSSLCDYSVDDFRRHVLRFHSICDAIASDDFVRTMSFQFEETNSCSN